MTVLTKPTADELHQVLEALEPNFVYLQGEQLEDSEQIGSLVWEDVDLSNPEALCGLFSSKLPNTVSVLDFGLWCILSCNHYHEKGNKNILAEIYEGLISAFCYTF